MLVDDVISAGTAIREVRMPSGHWYAGRFRTTTRCVRMKQAIGILNGASASLAGVIVSLVMLEPACVAFVHAVRVFAIEEISTLHCIIPGPSRADWRSRRRWFVCHFAGISGFSFLRNDSSCAARRDVCVISGS